MSKSSNVAPLSPGARRKKLNIVDPATGKSVLLDTDSTDSAASKPKRAFSVAEPTTSTQNNNGVLAGKSKVSKSIAAPTKQLKLCAGNEKAEFYAGVPPRLKVNSVYNVEYGFVEDTGRFVFIMENESTDRAIKRWTEYFLSNDNDLNHLLINEILQYLMVMVVDQTTGTVIRGRVLAENGGVVAIYCVDDGKVAMFPSNLLYLTTAHAACVQWKNVLCLLDGMEFFFKTPMFAKAIERCEAILENKEVNITCLRMNKQNVPVVQVDFRNESAIVNFNDILLAECIKECTFELPKKGSCRGDVVHVEADGLVVFHLESDNSSGELMNEYLATFNMEDLHSVHPHVDAGNVSLTDIYVTVFQEDGFLYRAKVLKTLTDTDEGMMALVEFIDYGNTANVPFGQMCKALYVDKVLTEIPPLACKAYLKWIQHFIDVDCITDELTQDSWEILIRRDNRNGLPMVCLIGEGEDNWNQKVLREDKAVKG